MKLRFGIVGCGAIAEEMHIPTLLRCPDVELVALFDADRKHARRLADRHEILEAHQHIAELAVALDAVVICTPPAVRPALIEQAFSMGLDVLAEKPLANSTAECAEIVSLGKKSQRVLAVSHMFRFYPVRARMHDLIAQHSLGPVRSVEIHEGAPYAWNPRSGYTFKRGEVSGGVLVNAGIHSLDSMIQWFGEPSIVSYEDDALGGLESNVRVHLSFASGVTADFRISRTCRLPSLFRIVCERGSIEFSNRDTVQYNIRINDSISSHHCDDAAQTPPECWLAQLTDFVDAIRHARKPRTDGTEAGRVVSLVEAMYRLKRNRPLPESAPVPGATW